MKPSEKIGLALAVTLTFGGCANKPFQPIPPLFRLWSKSGTDGEEVKRALLACGHTNVGTGFDVQDMRTGKVSQNVIVTANRCMEKAGFTYHSGKRTCDYAFNAHLPACKEDLNMPVEHRGNL